MPSPAINIETRMSYSSSVSLSRLAIRLQWKKRSTFPLPLGVIDIRVLYAIFDHDVQPVGYFSWVYSMSNR
jgi:hypothetical protein